jgi:Ca2+-transporting ATPase
MNINWHLLSLSEVSQKLDTSPAGLDEKKTARPSMAKNEIDFKKKNTVSLDEILINCPTYDSNPSWRQLSQNYGRLNRYYYNSYHHSCQRVSFVQEYRAEKAMEALKNIIPEETR